MSKSAFPVSLGGRGAARPVRLALGVLACLAVAQPMSVVARGADNGQAAHAMERPVHDHDKAAASPIVVTKAYTAAPRPGVPNLAVYIGQVHNRGRQADQLLSASTDIARTTELHEMKIEGDTMRMRQVPAIDIPAGASVDMNKGAPSGYHLMVLGVSRPLKAGDTFPLTLNFRQGGSQVIQVQVQDVARPGAAHEHHHGHEGHGGHAHGG